MARELVAVTVLEGSFGDYGAGDADVTMTVPHVVNKQYHVLQEGDIVVAHNTQAGAQTVTFDSVADPETGRSGDITTYSIGIDEYAAFGPFTFRGWRQPTTGWLHYEASHVDVLLGVLRKA